MKLIVGLGNPGEEYKYTKHNIGAIIAREFAKEHKISLRRKKYLSQFGEGRINNENVIVILPLTYMNLSGEAVSAVINDKMIDISDILVVSDDADLELGRIRFRAAGSDGGHKGLRSISENLDTHSFARLKIGIGKEDDLKSYVLSPFLKEDQKKITKITALAKEAVVYWLKNGSLKAMNKYNPM